MEGSLNVTMRTWQADQPYDSLPKLMGRNDFETTSVLRGCIRAKEALAELRAACRSIPGPGMLVATMPLLEAQASSEVENIVTTVDDLFRHMGTEAQASPQIKEALRYRHALTEGAEQLKHRPLATRTAEVVCSRIKGTDMAVRSVPGTRLANPVTGEVIYTPPQGEARLRELLTDWERFSHEPSPPDELIRIAVAHYQFEAIHPFTDGNGRTGRVLISLSLIEAGLLPIPVLYLSRYILQNRGDYYRLLLDVTRHAAWEPWVIFMLRGIEETARWTREKIEAMRALELATVAHTRDRLPKIYSRELVELLFAQPYTRIEQLVAATGKSRQTASKHLHDLERIGVVSRHTHGREVLFLNTRLMQLLTREGNEFAAFG